MKLHQAYFIILFTLFFFTAQAQLVNIEAKRMQTDSTRFVLKADLLANYSDNNGDYVLRIRSNISTQLKSKSLKNIYFLVLNYNLVRTQDEDFQNSWFLHLRYNHKITDVLRLEAFVQDQKNTQLTITRRKLIGVGMRIKLLNKKNTTSYLGNSYMYEIEELNSLDQRFFNHRNSSYFSLNQSFEKLNLLLTGTIYFQPLYRDFNNHRILSQFKAELPVTKTISISALYNYAYTNLSSGLENDRSSNINLGITLSL
jgi:hypothetical protein